MPPLVFKSLGPRDVTIKPFKVYKDYSISFVSGAASATPEISVVPAYELDDPNLFNVNTSPLTETGLYQEPLYETVDSTFYTSGALSSSANFSAGGDGFRNFPLNDSIYVVNVVQRYFGEGIRPGTFYLDTPAHGSGTIEDDGKGRLYVSGAGSSLEVVGNVFYNLGVAVVNKLDTTSNDELIQETGMYISESAEVRCRFKSTQTMYEWQAVTTILPYEFNYSSNPTAQGQVGTGSLLESGSELVVDAIASGTLSPYITTIGLYNDNYELVAIGKLPNPLKRLSKTKQSFVIRFDV